VNRLEAGASSIIFSMLNACRYNIDVSICSCSLSLSADDIQYVIDREHLYCSKTDCSVVGLTVCVFYT
jgi:hypothetical protein